MSYLCRECHGVCDFSPYKCNGKGKLLFVCRDCGHSFSRDVRQLLFDKNKLEL